MFCSGYCTEVLLLSDYCHILRLRRKSLHPLCTDDFLKIRARNLLYFIHYIVQLSFSITFIYVLIKFLIMETMHKCDFGREGFILRGKCRERHQGKDVGGFLGESSLCSQIGRLREDD